MCLINNYLQHRSDISKYRSLAYYYMCSDGPFFEYHFYKTFILFLDFVCKFRRNLPRLLFLMQIMQKPSTEIILHNYWYKKEPFLSSLYCLSREKEIPLYYNSSILLISKISLSVSTNTNRRYMKTNRRYMVNQTSKRNFSDTFLLI